MPGPFRDAEHLVRMAALFAAGVLAFVIVRAVLVPEAFGELGHFRTGALADNSAVALRYAGRDACRECHDEPAAQHAGGAHAGIGCESCHGPLAAHADDPGSLQPDLPQATPLCVGCHRLNVARPDWFPQVDPAEHADGEACDECHLPHSPAIE